MTSRFSRKQALELASAPANPRSLIASAVQVQVGDLLSWKSWALGRDEAWQRELWRLYDNVGEFRFAANWVGSAMSRCRIYVAEINEDGSYGPETTDPDVLALNNSMLGGPAQKAELFRLMGINITVGGEFYIIGKSGRSTIPTPVPGSQSADEWFVTTPAQLKRWAGGVTYYGPDGPMQLLNGVDMIIRVWTPHPARTWLADSPARGAMQILIEVERLTRYVASQIDSRLFSGGLLPIPDNMDFQSEDDQMGAADSLMSKLAEAGTASLKGEGSAAGIMPMVIEVPPESLGKIALIKFDSGLSQQALDLRKEAIQRFAYSMDFPPEVITGQGSSNHWSAWYIDENAIKVHIEPPLTRICAALYTAYLYNGLIKLGKDPAKFGYQIDTSGLTVRPTRLQDAINLFKEGILGPDAVLEAGYFRQDQKMTEDESAQIFGRLVAIQDPSQLQSPSFAKMTGIPAGVEVNAPAAPPPPPPHDTHAQDNPLQPLPERATTPPGQTGKPVQQTQGLQASSVRPETLVLAALTNQTVLRALELAGGRMTDRSGVFNGTPKHERHLLLRTNGQEQINKLLAGAWTHVPSWSDQAGVDADRVTEILESYTTQLLRTSQPHDANNLLERLRREGLIDD
jgi:hypothetical protein